jgi:hypothetical protein
VPVHGKIRVRGTSPLYPTLPGVHNLLESVDIISDVDYLFWPDYSGLY